MNSEKYRIPKNLFALSKEEYAQLHRNLFIKIKSSLKNKYNSIVQDKGGNIDLFDDKLKALIINYNFQNFEEYNKLFIKSEKAFLHYLSKLDDQKRKILSKNNVRDLIGLDNYYFSNDSLQIIKPKLQKKKITKSPLDKEIHRLNQEKIEIEYENKIQKNQPNK